MTTFGLKERVQGVRGTSRRVGVGFVKKVKTGESTRETTDPFVSHSCPTIISRIDLVNRTRSSLVSYEGPPSPEIRLGLPTYLQVIYFSFPFPENLFSLSDTFSSTSSSRMSRPRVPITLNSLWDGPGVDPDDLYGSRPE